VKGAAVTVRGDLMGRRIPTDPQLDEELAVRVAEGDACGPAGGSFVLVGVSNGGGARARYISWITYADLDEAEKAEPGRWTIVEPPVPYSGRVTWLPFGWGPLELVWTHPPPAERLAFFPLRNGVGTDRLHLPALG
jgi:hypothetical protein